MLGVVGVAAKAGTDVADFAVVPVPDRGEAAAWEELADRLACVPLPAPWLGTGVVAVLR
jgi:hypothetical protein